MRKVIFLLCIFLSTLTYGQNIKGGLSGGLNASQVDGDCLGGYSKLGLTGGVMALIPMSKNVSMSMEIIFSQRGSREPFKRGNTTGSSYRLTLRYIDIPLLINYAVDKRLTFGTGLILGTLASAKEVIDGVENIPISPEFNKFDIAWTASVRYKFTDHFYFDPRWSLTLPVSPIRRIGDCHGRLVGQLNKYISLRVVYMFNE